MASTTQAKLLVAIFVASWFIAGFVEPLLDAQGRAPPEVVLPHALLLGLVAFAWCKVHASSRGVPVPAYAPLVAGLAWPVGIPLYLARAFPWRTALVGIAKALVALVVSAGLYVGGTLVSGRVAA
jgi:hypothetical protein